MVMEKGSWWQRSLNSRLRSLESKSSYSLKSRRRIERRIKTFERTCESITVVDLIERRRIAKELAWESKWNTRRAKFNV